MFCGALLLQPDFSCRATQGSVPVRKQRQWKQMQRDETENTYCMCAKCNCNVITTPFKTERESQGENGDDTFR